MQGVNKSFLQENGSQHQVLRNINLEIIHNEFVTFIGPSGCGKSTLLNLLAGLIPPDSGGIVHDGRMITAPGSDRVMVFQEAALFPWLTVIENVMFGLKDSMDKETAYQRALQQLHAVHLAKFKDSYPHQLSGGMKQRVAIARALVIDPEILLMDEPFGTLDEQTRLILQNELMGLWLDTNKTIVFVTHNIREAIKLSDRIVVFGTEPGRVITTISVDQPRPRDKENSYLIRMENKVLQLLQSEIKTAGEANYEAINA